MAPARCSSCHCYSRNCPEGLPNHRHSTAVGVSCTMNSQGRHYRDQADVSNPVCDYEKNGESCDFFSTTNNLSSLPYPTDISLGSTNTAAESETGNGDLSQIFVLLQQQKADTDRQFALIQSQVTALTRGTPCSTPATTIPTVSSVTFSSRPLVSNSTSSMSMPVMSTAPIPAYTLPPVPSLPPPSLANAAAALNSHLSTGLGYNHNLGYQPLTMDQLRGNIGVTVEADRMLQQGIRNVPPLNPVAGMAGAVGATNNVSTVDQLYAATMRNKQLKAFEFAATGQFSYKNQLKQDNMNAITFAYGCFKHLEAAKLGLIEMDDNEFLARLRHLKNVYEVACLSSNLSSFTDNSWQVAREYDTRVIADIESGAKTWSTLSKGLETDAIYCANQIVELKTKAKKPGKDPKDPKNPRVDKDRKSKACTTYNTHRSSEGCFWEHNNKGESCIFEHFCSWCKSNRDVKEKHKVFDCEHKTD